MKFRIFAALLLAALLAGLLFMARNLDERYRMKLEIYEAESAQLAEYEARVAALEDDVQQLVKRQAEHEARAAELTGQAEEMEAQRAALEAEKPELLAEIERIEAELAALRATTDQDSDEAYYLEVYDALTKGLETVKGYLSDN